MIAVFTAAWWVAAGQRAAYTALAAFLPLGALLVAGLVTPLYVLCVVTAAGLASAVTSLAGIPEAVDRTVPLWRAILIRVLKTSGQVAAPVLISVTVITDVGWYELGVAVGGAALSTLVRTLMAYLPEVDLDEQTVPVAVLPVGTVDETPPPGDYVPRHRAGVDPI